MEESGQGFQRALKELADLCPAHLARLMCSFVPLTLVSYEWKTLTTHRSLRVECRVLKTRETCLSYPQLLVK